MNSSDRRLVRAPRRLPLAGHAVELACRRARFFQDLRPLGDIVEIRLGPRPVYVVNAPAMVHRLLVDEANHVQRAGVFDKLRLFLGDGIGTSDGAHHRRQRALMRPAFQRARLAGYAELMSEATEAHLAAWRPGQRLAVDREMQELTLAIVSRTLFSAHLPGSAIAEVRRSLPVLMNTAIWRTLAPSGVLDAQFSPVKRRFDAARDRLRQILDDALAAYRQDDADHGDLLSMLTSGAPEMSDEQLRDEVMTILATGSQSPGHVLSSVFFELGRNPAVAARLYREVDEVVGGRRVTVDDVAGLRYLDCVVKEALRLHNPLWLLTRRTDAEITVDGVTLPSGADVVFSPRAMHRDPALFPEPLSFDPDRWLPDRAADLPKGAYLPFLVGPHRCIGELFALVEVPLVVATVTAGWRLSPTPGRRPREVTRLLAHLDRLPMVAVPR